MLVTQAVAGAPPGEINEPSAANAVEGDKTTTNGHTYKNYQWFWKYTCAFTKWVPTNQYLYANMTYDPETMTLERYGYIGMDKRCFWGMVGVKWMTPLKVNQIHPKSKA